MKISFGLFLCLLISLSSHSQHLAPFKADCILSRVSRQLNSVKNIWYASSRELNYASENYHNTSQWTVYVDFYSQGKKPGFKYQIDDAVSKQVFNGTEKFELDKKQKTIAVDDNPDHAAVNNVSALYNSIITVKHVLPQLVNDATAIKSVTDTSIGGKYCQVVTVNIGKRRIQNSGQGFDVMTTKSNFIYKIIIDTISYLPVEVLQQNDLNEDLIKTSFTNIKINIAAPEEMSWYYQSYAGEFNPMTEKAAPHLLTTGSLAPEWKLSLYNESKTVSLNDLKGTVILLDFWIKNCSPCIESVPHLNALQDKFKGKKFKVISVNLYDTKEEVSWFCNKHKAAYPVLLNGKAVAEKYGVNSFPTFFVIDKAGKIIYFNKRCNKTFRHRRD